MITYEERQILVAELKDRFKAMEDRLESLEAELATATNKWVEYRDLAASKAAALEKYGIHFQDCGVSTRPDCCDCGLDQELSR